MVHKAAWDDAVARSRTEHERRHAEMAASKWEHERGQAARFSPPSEQDFEIHLFVRFAYGACVEPFALQRPFGSQGWEAGDLQSAQDLLDVTQAQLDRHKAKFTERRQDYGGEEDA